MMRGMFAAISGLKAHQTMLDVTANDLANVNTIGYKSARDDVRGRALAAPARRIGARPPASAARTPCRSASASRLGSIDNLMTAGSLQSTGNPLDLAIQGDGFFRVGAGTPPATPPYTRSSHHHRVHARRQLDHERARLPRRPRTAKYVIGHERDRHDRAAPPTYAPGTNDTYINVPPRLAGRGDRPGRHRHLHRRATRRPPPTSSGSRPGTSRWRRSRTRPACSASATRTGPITRELRRRGRRHAGHDRLRHDDRGRGRDVERRPGQRVHDHDHGRARLPGQLARDHHRRPDAPGRGEHEAVVRAASGLSGRRGGHRGRPPLQSGPPPRSPRRNRAVQGENMITLHRLGHAAEPFQLNPDLIVTVEANARHRGHAHHADQDRRRRDAGARRRADPRRAASSCCRWRSSRAARSAPPPRAPSPGARRWS